MMPKQEVVAMLLAGCLLYTSSKNGNVVCIERGPKLTYDIHYKIRLVAVSYTHLLEAGHVAVVVSAPDVDGRGEAPLLQLVAVVGDVGGEVGV